MLFRLVVEKHGKPTKAVQLNTACAHIGRAHGNEVRIPSAEVSRRHCQLRADDGLLKVQDLESVNGTYLNGDLITAEAILRPGDRLEVGPVTFIVEYELTPAALARLQDVDCEVVVEDDMTDEVSVAEEDEPQIARKPKGKSRRPPVEDDVIEEVEEVLEAEEVVESEEYEPRIDLDEVKWMPAGEGDLRDLLSHLDEGQESMMPRKRPTPRRKPPTDGRSEPEA